jgi:hypothetical protein
VAVQASATECLRNHGATARQPGLDPRVRVGADAPRDLARAGDKPGTVRRRSDCTLTFRNATEGT